MFRVLYVHHRRFLYSLNAANARTGDDLQVLRRLAMQTSARNQFSGKIARLTRGAVNDEVELVLSGGDVLTATVTHTSSETLGLRKGARSEEHTSELQSLMSISYAVFCLKKKTQTNTTTKH